MAAKPHRYIKASPERSNRRTSSKAAMPISNIAQTSNRKMFKSMGCENGLSDGWK